MARKLFIGTSGWHYKHWLGLFYPAKFPPKEMLAFYAKHFDTVELNNSFYHLPLPSAFDTWRETVPSGFRFAVKGSRFITHMKKLKDPETATEKFFLGAERLHEKLGPILFQLPPHWKLNLERLAEFLQVLPGERQYAFEFREDSWYSERVYELLRSHNAALCIHDLAGKQTPIKLTANFTYVRFHGPTKAKYSGSYSNDYLEQWAKKIEDWEKDLSAVYVYFNNDIGGHAIFNAKTLKRMV